jgi:AraC-like DNA-binding protein
VVSGGPLAGVADLAAAPGTGHLHLLRRGALQVTGPQGLSQRVAEPSVLLLPCGLPHRLAADPLQGADIVTATVDFGAGDENPLLRSLPPLLCMPLAHGAGLDLGQQLLSAEVQARRCGHGAVVDRLAEVLVIQLLRQALAEGLVDAGAMAGLSDPRLARALAALHGDPSRAWTVDAMAATAGMSRARFAVHFASTVGVPPGEYLTSWRLGLARQQLRRGRPVKEVAAEVGYASPGAFGRVFLQNVGATPGAWQRSAGPGAAPLT